LSPEVPIEVDAATGEWSVDGIPMILVPRHFFLNNHLAIESSLGLQKYAEILFAAGRKSAYAWCEKEAATHGLSGEAVFHHYMKRLSQRGWGQFRVESLDPEAGLARISVRNSVFVKGQAGHPRKTCYMFRGWFPGALELVLESAGLKLELTSNELHCAAEGGQDHCLFETAAL
jgi:predicted hydrocarbon binding protein